MATAEKWIIARSDWHAVQALKQIYSGRRAVSCLFNSYHAAVCKHRKMPEMKQEEYTIFEIPSFDEDKIRAC